MLIQQVLELLEKYNQSGWGSLFALMNIELTSPDGLKARLIRPIDSTNLNKIRELEGFTEMPRDAKRLITPGNPSKSILYHAFASPGVRVRGATRYPSLADIELLENYVFAAREWSTENLMQHAEKVRQQYNGNDPLPLEVAVVVYATEYRQKPRTVHRQHADLCFSRTGVSRVGNKEPQYMDNMRGFWPSDSEIPNDIHTIPVKYAPYLSVLVKRPANGDNEFGPWNNEAHNDTGNYFWVPLHKLFEGDECLQEMNFSELKTRTLHRNEKVGRVFERFIREGIPGYNRTEYPPNVLKKPPYRFTEEIAKLSDWNERDQRKYGKGVLIPEEHSLVVKVNKSGQQPEESLPLTLPARASLRRAFYLLDSSLYLPAPLNAPEFVHIRHDTSGKNLNDATITTEALLPSNKDRKTILYNDYTADGYVDVTYKVQTSNNEHLSQWRKISMHPAYSIVAAIDFYPKVNQRELVEKNTNTSYRIPPDALCDIRHYPNLQFTDKEGKPVFTIENEESLLTQSRNQADRAITAIVCLPPFSEDGQQHTNREDSAVLTSSSYRLYDDRQPTLPDTANGVFDPGWSIAVDATREGNEHFTAYPLGLPFLEDTRLCSALSSFWPAVAVDSRRTFLKQDKEPNNSPSTLGRWEISIPPTDKEISGQYAWDGIEGPKWNVEAGSIEYPNFENTDNVEQGLQNKYSLVETSRISTEEYIRRKDNYDKAASALVRLYKEENIQIATENGVWDGYYLISFKVVKASELDTVQEAVMGTQYQAQADEIFYYYVFAKLGEPEPMQNNVRKLTATVLNEKYIVITANQTYLYKEGSSNTWGMNAEQATRSHLLGSVETLSRPFFRRSGTDLPILDSTAPEERGGLALSSD